jgi:hypothetical protein
LLGRTISDRVADGLREASPEWARAGGVREPELELDVFPWNKLAIAEFARYAVSGCVKRAALIVLSITTRAAKPSAIPAAPSGPEHTIVL